MSRRVRPALQRSRVLIRATLIIIVLFFFYSPLVRPSAARSLALGYYILISIEHTYSRIATQLYRTQRLTLLRCCCTATVQIPDKCILCACCKYLRRSWQQRPPSRLWLIDFIVYLYASFTSCFCTLAAHSLTTSYNPLRGTLHQTSDNISSWHWECSEGHSAEDISGAKMTIS